MVKKSKGKHRLDKFYHLAKEQGYRSRAAFKLIQLNRKYDFLSSARSLLDLCAAPGGWCQVAVKNMPVGSLILGVDLAPIKPIRGVKTFIGDITTQQCRQQIKKETGGDLVDVVLHDGAPNVGGAWSSEAYSQSWLALEALRMATDVLAPRGTFVTKVFRSKDYSALLYALNQLFTTVEATKPAASRNASAEIFVVCLGYKAPSKIDPRLLDPKHLFQEVAEAPRVMGPDALLKQKIKQKRHREGYEDGISLMSKSISAAAFVCAENPVELLGQYTSLILDGALSEQEHRAGDDNNDDDDSTIDNLPQLAETIRNHPSTTDEIRILCKDLQVLGRSEFKQLLKWRLNIKKEIDRAAKAAAAEAKQKSKDDDEDSDGDGEEKEMSLEDKLLAEMTEIKERMDKKKKREKKRRRELKMKARMRTAQLAQAEGIGEEDTGPDGLFSLSSLKTKKGKGVDGVVDADAPTDSDVDAMSSSDEEFARKKNALGRKKRGEDDSDDDDSDDDQRRYDAIMDEYLEESYRAWKERQRMKNGIVKKRRKRLGMDGELDEEDSDDDGGGDGYYSDGDDESEEEEEEEEGGGLIVGLDEKRAGVAVNADAAAKQWFSQDIFDDDNIIDDDHGDDDMDSDGDGDVDGGMSDDSEDDDDNVVVKEKKSLNGFDDNFVGAGSSGEKSNGFEVVPLSDSDGDSDSAAEEFEDLDDNAKAEVLALAKKFLRRKSKDDIMEAAYNRYAFHDTNLPKWFEEDERKFMRPAPQITADEYKAAKEELKAIDARPIKKVAEAKARKRKRLVAKLTQARQKAEAVANQEDMPMNAKMREIEKIYNQAKSGGKGKKKSSRSDQYKKKGRPLDARMRKDKRGMEAAMKRMKGKGKKGRVGGGGGGKKKGGRR